MNINTAIIKATQELIKRDHKIEKLKLVQEIDQKELELIIFHKEELQIIE